MRTFWSALATVIQRVEQEKKEHDEYLAKKRKHKEFTLEDIPKFLYVLDDPICCTNADPHQNRSELYSRSLAFSNASGKLRDRLGTRSTGTGLPRDSNTDPKAKSSEHTRMLIGYIQSMGYEYLVKPDAWATFVADRHSRGLARRERAAFQA